MDDPRFDAMALPLFESKNSKRGKCEPAVFRGRVQNRYVPPPGSHFSYDSIGSWQRNMATSAMWESNNESSREKRSESLLLASKQYNLT